MHSRLAKPVPIDLCQKGQKWICGGSRSKGFGVIGFIVTIPLVLIGLVIIAFAYAEASKAYWDNRVKDMCDKDGGIKVLETVKVGKQQWDILLNQFGQLSPPLENLASDHVPIVHKNISTYIRRNNPEVRRDELVVIRKSDKKVLGTAVSYSRVGGDLISFHPSYFSCPEKSVDVDVFSAVILQSKEQR